MEIVKISHEHYDEVFAMMKIFYSSDAVFTQGSDEIFHNDIMQCLSDNPYIEGYVFIEQEIVGYGMLAKSFSTEFSKQCIWIEDIYIKENFRHRGMGSQFLSFVSDMYQDCLIRLEVEKDNIHALNTYKKNGFSCLPYQQMFKYD